jgi:hypothetical protein
MPGFLKDYIESQALNKQRNSLGMENNHRDDEDTFDNLPETLHEFTPFEKSARSTKLVQSGTGTPAVESIGDVLSQVKQRPIEELRGLIRFNEFTNNIAQYRKADRPTKFHKPRASLIKHPKQVESSNRQRVVSDHMPWEQVLKINLNLKDKVLAT